MIVLWLCAYTLSLCNTLFVLYVWTLNKQKAVFALFLVVLNVFITTAIPFLSIMLNAFTSLSEFLLYLFIAFFSLSIPHFIFSSISTEHTVISVPKWYTALCLVLITGFCFLFLSGNTKISFWISVFLPLISILSTIGVKKSCDTQNDDQKQLSKTGISLFIIASSLFILYGILYYASSNREMLSQYFFGFFPIAYQIPVFLYNTVSVQKHLQTQKEFLEKIQQSFDDEISVNQNVKKPSASLLCERLHLSKREAETAVKLFEGKTYNQIADELFVSLSAVKKHAYNIYRKLDITNNRQLMQKINDIL